MFFNLDQKWDHFLIDEFQDTSLLQWKVIKLFVDELLQNNDGSRSFFCVGDPKQSIYGWRGACGELIDSIVSLFQLEKQELTGSRRSAWPILNMVNRLFGNFEVIGELFPECVEIWKKRWTVQHCIESNFEGYGCFLCVIEPPKEKEFGLENASNEEIEGKQGEQTTPNSSTLRFEAIKRLLIDEIKPQEKKVSCAILVQTNKEAADIFHYLSACSNLKVSLEGKIYPGKDNTLAKFFSALVQSIAHPNDSLALGWLQATPVGDIFREELWRKNIWEKLFMGGFLEVASWLFAVLEKKYSWMTFIKREWQ
ncbi:UvrD-helicase domain-containing protein [Methylacidiphilum kamchatkense]|uniref:UvrD-helicase domain-containing protein n=1 Tax=Methylacidiphilum kamchatkense TaxID=431057 RepID=UPI0009A19B27|nr:UvrD-helicase domain-containing protein [Methylacidiphilum kamchatkense]